MTAAGTVPRGSMCEATCGCRLRKAKTVENRVYFHILKKCQPYAKNCHFFISAEFERMYGYIHSYELVKFDPLAAELEVTFS